MKMFFRSFATAVNFTAVEKQSLWNFWFICTPDSPFIEEGRKLLIQEFGKKYGTYFSILQAISEGYNTQAQISDYLGSKSIGGQLLKLEETYNLIEKKRPMWASKKSQTVRFEIGQYPLLEKALTEDYNNYTGDKEAHIIEVKRNADKYDPKLLEEKVTFFVQKEKRIRKYKRTIECASLKDI